MRTSVGILLLLAWLGTPWEVARADEPSQARLQELGRQLLDERLEVALDAAKALHALGKHAAPVLPELLQALARELDEHTASLHWHPDQGRLPQLHREVLLTLEAIGPAAKPAAPALALRLQNGRDRAVVGALLAIAPDDEKVFGALSTVVASGRWYVDAPTAARLRAWVETQGARAVPMLAGVLERGDSTNALWAVKRLIALGKIGEPALLRRLETAHWMGQRLVLEAFVGTGRLPAPAVPAAVRWFASTAFNGDHKAFGKAIASSTSDAALLGKALAARELYEPPWLELFEASRNLAQKATAAWFAARRPALNQAGFDEHGLRRTATRGGGGGGPFADRPSKRATLVGLRVTTSTWSGFTIISSVRPCYDGPEGPLEGDLHGRSRGPVTEVKAPKGWAIGGLVGKGGKRVNGFAVIFFRRVGDRLDPTQARVSPWLGGTGGGMAILLGGEGHRIVGLFGRQGADLDAIGLIEAR